MLVLIFIKNTQWASKHNKNLNLLLIDDRCEEGFYGIKVPNFTGENENDDVLKQLIPYLTNWNKYTQIDKVGTTRQFIKLHGKPKFE